MREHFVLAGQRCRRDLRNHETRVQSRMIREERRKVAVFRVEQSFYSAFGNIGEHRKCDGHEVECETQGLAMKIPSRKNVAALRKHERIVRRAIQFDSRSVADVFETFTHWPVD